MLDAMNSLQAGNGSFILRQHFKLLEHSISTDVHFAAEANIEIPT
jgi:hypothetical protein